MGQEEVLEVMKRIGNPTTAIELALELDDRVSHICNILGKLIKTKDIGFKVISGEEKKKYGKGRSFRIYFIIEDKGNRKLQKQNTFK